MIIWFVILIFTLKIREESIESEFVVTNASEANAGTYTCKVMTIKDEPEKDVASIMVHEATRILTEASLVEVVSGSRFVLDCHVRVVARLADSLEVLWFKDNVRLSTR